MGPPGAPAGSGSAGQVSDFLLPSPSAPPQEAESDRRLNPCHVHVRMEPQLAQALLERARQEKLQQAGRVSSGLSLGRDQEALR